MTESLTVSLPSWIDDVVDLDRPYPDPDDRMRLAIALARENVVRDSGGPFGAVVFESESGRPVAVGMNLVVGQRNSVLHAEIVALMLAEQAADSYTLGAAGLPAHELVASCSPCAMCLGAALWSGVRRIVAGATREDAMAFGFDEGPVFPESYQYLEHAGLAVVTGVLRAEARAVLELYRERGGIVYNG
jgi:tRNA(Arg) A34 adenosine deaminase TadA